MIICTILLLPYYIIQQILIPIIQQIITTVCSWVSTIITTINTVLNQICGWLPWPFNKLCKWVTTVITVIQTIWNYICNTIIQTIITIITYIIALLIYIIRIICIIINVIIGIPSFLLCLLRLSPPKKLRICIKVLTDERGNTRVMPEAIRRSIERTIRSYAECNIEVIILGIEYIVKPEYLTTTNCSWYCMFCSWHTWFSQTACWCCNQVTVFFVDDIIDADGCSYPGDNWCRVDDGANFDDTIMAHEIGHLLGLLGHSSDPNNLMHGQFSPTSNILTSFQCCLIRQSPFVTYF